MNRFTTTRTLLAAALALAPFSAASAAAPAGEAALSSAFSLQRDGLRAALTAAKAAPQAAPAAPAAPASTPISYDGLAKSFDGAAPAASAAPLLGSWMEVAYAVSTDRPGKYSAGGFWDVWHPNQPQGVAFRLIPAQPPIQNEDAYELAEGNYSADGKSFATDGTLAMAFNGRGAIQNVPAHEEEDPITCGNCEGGPTTHWEDARTYEFRVIGDKKDYVIERETVGGNYDAASKQVSGGESHYYGFILRPAK